MYQRCRACCYPRADELCAERKTEPGSPFDVGSAWENLALQATKMGIVSHGMAGFEFEKSRRDLNVPEHFAVAAMCALGRPGSPANLPADLQSAETPRGRRPVRESICEGPFCFYPLSELWSRAQEIGSLLCMRPSPFNLEGYSVERLSSHDLPALQALLRDRLPRRRI